MKKILGIALGTILLVSCGGSEGGNGEGDAKGDAKGNGAGTTVTSSGNNEPVKSFNQSAFSSNLEDFQACKKVSNKGGSCKNYLAKAIGECWGIEDFKEKGEPINYDDIPKALNSSSNWVKLGDVNESNITEAMNYVGKEKPVLVINTKDSYTHVVVLTNGEMKTSRKWGNIKIPNCISFFPSRPAKSFLDKGLNYAFSKQDGLEIWAREK